MPFHFSLETVLRYRKSREHAHELLLQAANQRVANARVEIQKLDDYVAAMERQKQLRLQTGLSSAELQFEGLRRTNFGKRRKVLEAEAVRLDALRRKQVEVLRQARREREVIEGLRTRELQIYRQTAARQEQRSSDDQFLLRRAFLRHS